MPVRRVGGVGRSVFAYTAEIDDWLMTNKPVLMDPIPSAGVTTVSTSNRLWPWLLLGMVTISFIVGLYARPRPIATGDLNVEVTSGGLIARDAERVEQWRQEFPSDYQIALPAAPVQQVGGTRPGVYFATSYRSRRNEDQVESGELTLLDMAGRRQRSFVFDDRVRFQGQVYGAPWALTSFAVNHSGGTYRVAVTGHHYTWDAGLVTILDQEWQRRGTFVHAGWIEQVRWLSPERLLIGGFSNAHDGGMVALLDAAALDGQGPEPDGSRHFCDNCGPNGPLRMFVFPRTELNRASASPFNRVLLNTSDGRLSARTVEMPAANGDADAVYEFTPSLDLMSARFSERYWEMHQALEAQGKIAHPRAQCPDRDGPRQFELWEPGAGWRTIRIR